ncbi:hypothetical protein [Kineococcus terrestris]|uniref:hypothetical protein n=1 Tax=Kineococcus terrestris TaxID=2044856 RepID=UPI0034DB2055
MPPFPRRALLVSAGCALVAGCSPSGRAGAVHELRVEHVRSLLRRRADALLAGDLAAAAVPVLTRTAAERDLLRLRDGRAAAARPLELAADVTALTAPRTGPGGGVGASAHVVLRSRLPGEGRTATAAAVLGLRRDGERWWLAPGPVDGPVQPWEVGALEVREVPGGAVVLVRTGAPAAGATAGATTGATTGAVTDAVTDVVAAVAADVGADLADAAARAGAAWGADPPRAAVLVAADAAAAARLAGTSEQRAALVDALTTGGRHDLPGGRRGAARVVVQAGRFAGLTRTGRRVVLTHELVHVATRAGGSTDPAAPRWLAEGYADVVARAGRGLDPRALAEPVLRDLGAGGAVDVPADEDFTGGPGESTGDAALQRAHAAAWTLVASTARHHGLPALTALHRRLNAADRPATASAREALLAAAWREHLGEEPVDALARWRRDLDDRLAGWV